MAPPASTPVPERRPMTTKQARKQWQKAGCPTVSKAERKKLERDAELDARAREIRDKDRRIKENKKKREEKEAREKEKRRRMGIEEEIKLPEGQLGLGQFFKAKPAMKNQVGVNNVVRVAIGNEDEKHGEAKKEDDGLQGNIGAQDRDSCCHSHSAAPDEAPKHLQSLILSTDSDGMPDQATRQTNKHLSVSKRMREGPESAQRPLEKSEDIICSRNATPIPVPASLETRSSVGMKRGLEQTTGHSASSQRPHKRSKSSQHKITVDESNGETAICRPSTPPQAPIHQPAKKRKPDFFANLESNRAARQDKSHMHPISAPVSRHVSPAAEESAVLPRSFPSTALHKDAEHVRTSRNQDEVNTSLSRQSEILLAGILLDAVLQQESSRSPRRVQDVASVSQSRLTDLADGNLKSPQGMKPVGSAMAAAKAIDPIPPEAILVESFSGGIDDDDLMDAVFEEGEQLTRASDLPAVRVSSSTPTVVTTGMTVLQASLDRGSHLRHLVPSASPSTIRNRPSGSSAPNLTQSFGCDFSADDVLCAGIDLEVDAAVVSISEQETSTAVRQTSDTRLAPAISRPSLDSANASAIQFTDSFEYDGGWTQELAELADDPGIKSSPPEPQCPRSWQIPSSQISISLPAVTPIEQSMYQPVQQKQFPDDESDDEFGFLDISTQEYRNL